MAEPPHQGYQTLLKSRFKRRKPAPLSFCLIKPSLTSMAHWWGPCGGDSVTEATAFSNRLVASPLDHNRETAAQRHATTPHPIRRSPRSRRRSRGCGGAARGPSPCGGGGAAEKVSKINHMVQSRPQTGIEDWPKTAPLSPPPTLPEEFCSP